ncbi:hypothetical protein AYO47_00985 [Planctomyces sp. SCGC AG-212-M04]|nr:hypothetical protein AYO47_00985 [Planctomyces sp. SCGC AG-212-M04]
MHAVCALCRRLSLLAIVVFCGCAAGPYQVGHGWASNSAAAIAKTGPATEAVGDPQPIEVAHGRRNVVIDGIGWVFGIPGKLIYWDRRFENHDVSPATESAVVEYLACNHLEDVTVRVNQYAPWQEWKRLQSNTNVGAGWRYTFGLVNLAGYTIFPGRLFGGDRYNPYTNSVYVYSDIAPLGIYSSAYSKDVHSREYPGTYAAVNEFAIASLWHDTIAADDALGYLAQRQDQAAYEEGVAFLHPYYGSQVGVAAESVVGAAPLLWIGGAIAGHLNGRREIRLSEQSRTQAVADWVELRPATAAGSGSGAAIQQVGFTNE